MTPLFFPLATLDEILLSSDKTIAIIDGSGVLADPAGIDREELIRLAKSRLTVANFNLSKLSKEGYLVKVEEQDIRLPCEYIHPSTDVVFLCSTADHGFLLT